jgi:hypothetical protein
MAFEALHRKGDATCPRSRFYIQISSVAREFS